MTSPSCSSTRRSRSADRTGPSLLVVQTSFLGDVVLTTPLLAALDAHLQPRRLAVLVRPDAVPLLAGHPAVDDVLIDDKHARGGWTGGLRTTARRLRAEGFDLAVSPHRSTRTALLLALAGIPRRIGFASAGLSMLYQETVPRDLGRHDVERNLALLAPFGARPEPAPPLHVPVDGTAAARAAELLPVGDGPLVGLAPGSVWPTKRWTVDGFAAVARALRLDGARCVLLGAPNERPVCDAVAAAAPGTVVLAGRTDVATLVAVIDRLHLLVANDSAPMHIACARDVPVVAVFCATTPALGYGPWGDRTAVVQADLACRPCARHGGPACPRGTDDCQHLVTPAMVLADARRLLAGADGRAA